MPFESKEEKKDEAHIAPRHVQKRQPGDSKYKDRAELRRSGKDDEYKDVSPYHDWPCASRHLRFELTMVQVKDMLEDFEKRKAEAEDAESVCSPSEPLKP